MKIELKKELRSIREQAMTLIRQGKTLEDKDLAALFDLQDLLNLKIKNIENEAQ